MPDPNDPFDLGIEPLGSRPKPPSRDDPYDLGIEPLGGVSSSGRSQQESPWYENIATVPNAIRFGGSMAGDFAGGLLAPVTGGLSYPVLSFLGGSLGELGGQIAGGEDINLWTAGTEGALNLLPGPNIPGARAGLGEVAGYVGKSALSGAGQGILGANPRKWAQQGITNDEGINWATGEDYAREGTAGALFGGATGGALAGGRSLINATRSAFPSHITETQTPPGLRLLGEGTDRHSYIEPGESDWRNPREEDIQEGEIIPDDAPPYEPWRHEPTWDETVIPPTQPPPPDSPAGGATIEPDLNSPFGADEVAVGDSFDVLDVDITPGYIDQMRDMGFEPANKLPGGRTLFQRIASKLGDERGSIPSFEEIWKTLNMELGRPPSQAEIEARQGQVTGGDDASPFQTGESIQPAKPISMGVANFPVSLRHALDTILANTKNDAVVDQMAGDFQLQLGKVRDVQVLQEIVAEIDAAPQDAVTRALRDEVRRRIIAMSPPPTSGVPGGNVPVRQEGVRNFEVLPGGQTEVPSTPPNVAQFPEQPSAGLRDFHKEFMGQVQSGAADMQARAVELQQHYPNATDEQIRNVISIQNNINRRRTRGGDPAQQEELLTRVVAALQQQEANAPKSGPTGIVPYNGPTESGVENLRQQAVQGEILEPETGMVPYREPAMSGEVVAADPTQYGPKGEGFLRRTLKANPNLSAADIAQMHEFLLSQDAPSGLSKVEEQGLMPSFEEAKADLDARQDAGMVTDYEDELAALHESYGVISGMSTDMEKYVAEVQRAHAEGYKVLPPGYNYDPSDGPIARTFEQEDGIYKVVGHPHLVTEDNPTGQFNKQTNQLTEGSRDEPSFQRPYEDLTPDRSKRYEVYDEEGNLIHKTYDYDEAHRMADQENGYVFDTEQSSDKPSSQRADPKKLAREEARAEITKEIRQKIVDKINENIEAGRPPEEGVAELEQQLPRNETAFQKGWAKLSHEGKRLVSEHTLMARPDEPSFAKVAGGGLKVDADITRAATNLTKDYTGPLSAIMIREAGQNNFDAVKDMGGKGVVKFRINAASMDAQHNRTPASIETYDNGPGMTEQILSEKLVRLFGSGKENEAGASGGKGIGSASYLLGGEHVTVTTVAVDNGRKYRIIASGTPEQFLGPNGSDYERIEVPMSTPTGTTIKTILKQEQDAWDARDMLDKIVNFSRDKKMTIISDPYGHKSYDALEVADHSDGITRLHEIPKTKDDKVIGDYVFNESEVKVQIPKYDETQERTSYQVHYLNSGMYQFSENKYFDKVKGVPDNVIVNITPRMDEQEDHYPFINTRQDVKKDIRENIEKFIELNIKNPALDKRKNRTQELYDSMPVVPIKSSTKRKTVIFDPGERLTKGELSAIRQHPIMHELIAHYDEVTDAALRIIGRPAWGIKLEGIGMVFDPNMNGVHIPNPATKKSTILLNPFPRMESGMSPADNAFAHTITLWHEIAHIDESVMGYGSVRTPDIDLSDPDAAKFWQSYLQQMNQHGDVGWTNTGHGVGFIQRLGEVYASLGAAHTRTVAAKLERIFTRGSKSGNYDPELQRLLQIYTDSRGRPETTEDLLSGTGVKQANKRSTGERSIPPPDSPVGTGTPAGTAVELFRRNLPAVTDYETTRFILPDGHRVGFKGSEWGAEDYHSPSARGAGVPMDEALENGIVRFRPTSHNVAAEVHAPISSDQAVHLADSLHMLDKPYLIMEVMAPNGQRQHTIFEQGAKPGKIRDWVNNIFRKLSSETGAWNVFGRQPNAGAGGTPPPPRTPNYNTGGAAPPPPPGGGAGGLGGTGAGGPGRWAKVQQATGIGTGGKVVQNKQQMNWIKEAMAVPAGATTTMDLSAPFRQGLSMINTPQFWKAAYKMFGGLTESGFQQIDAELRRKPVMQARRNVRTGKVMPSIAQEAGLKMFETAGTGGMSQRAQATASRWLEEGIGTGVGSKIWKNTAGVPIRMSNRAYITFLNHLKVNRFEYLMDLSAKMHQDVRNTGTARPGLFRQKFTQAEGVELNGYRNKVLAREIAEFVNTATGQGPLKTHVLPFKQAEISLEGAAEALQHTFFSPGLIASRVRMLNPSTYIMASPMVRKQYMQAAVATGAAWMGALGMIEAAGGDDVEVNLSNLTSADFGKAKIGDTRMDPGGGFQQFLVAMGRMIQGGTTSSASNEWKQFGEGFNAPTQKSNIERFLTNKLNPVTKFAYDLAAQSEYNPFHVGDRVAQLFVPLVIQDLIGLYEENPKLLPWMAPIMFGMGTQTYGRGESVGKLIAPENDWLAAGGGVVDLIPGQEDY